MEEWENATDEQLADASAEAMVATANLWKRLINQRKWQQAADVAQTIAQMGAYGADACELMQGDE
jgi:hypothetical protein